MAKSLKRTDRFIVAKEIGERIKIYRRTKAVNMNQKEFAQYIGIDQGTLSKMENGDSVTIENLKQLSEKCGLSMDYLFFGEPKITDKNMALGLSEEALNFLSICKNSPILSETINGLLSHKNILFYRFLGNWKKRTIFNDLDFKDISIDGIEISNIDIRKYVYDSFLLQVMESIRESTIKEQWEVTDEERKAYENDNMFDMISQVFTNLNKAHFSRYPIFSDTQDIKEFLYMIDTIVSFCIYIGNTYVFEQFLRENSKLKNGFAYDEEYHLLISRFIKHKYGENGKEFVLLLDHFTEEWMNEQKKRDEEDMKAQREIDKQYFEYIDEIEQELITQVQALGYRVERADNGKH